MAVENFIIRGISHSLKKSSWQNLQILSRPPTPQTERLRFHNRKVSLRSSVKTKIDLKCTKSIEELQDETHKTLLQRALDPVSAMKLIDTLQCLGIAYHYEEEIDSWLETISYWNAAESLQSTALRFRLLRQNAMPVSCDVFKKFMGEKKFKNSLSQDTEGLLNLYEASYLGANGEDNMSEAIKFSEGQLIKSIQGLLPNDLLSRRVRRALLLPRHLRMERLESRVYIDEYGMQIGHDSIILQQAKLDYNQVQLLYKEELAELSRWWKNLGLADKLSFSRNQPKECFLWAVGILPEPKYSAPRIDLAKAVAMLIVLDDVYDAHGTMDDLSLFTHAIQRWDLNAIEQLPEYMKICYMALYNTTSEIAQRVLIEQGRNIMPFLARAWIDTIEAYMVEAQWVNSGCIPNLDRYMENRVTTSGAYMALVHTFFLIGHGLTPQNVKLMAKPYPKIFSNSGKILRLWDDLGTSKEEQDRGDNSSLIPLFMKERNLAKEERAREHLTRLILNEWKDLNSELVGANALPLSLVRACFNMARTSQVIYQHQEDNYMSSVDKIFSFLIFEPLGK
uniref:Putative geraniol synthase n=1 Tax=Scoparia dulcis TaxID=107240 RepID=A0A1W7HBY8_SCODU